MTHAFDYFVILAAKRTGSNLLEAGINQIPGVACHGELFNPGFIGREGVTVWEGIDLSSRFRRPERVLERMQTLSPGQINGFRLFAQHDQRILDHVLADRRCAKIILRRRPLAAYLSTLQAESTGQWRVGHKATQRIVKVAFDADAFEAYAADTESWYRRMEERIRVSGQSFFPIRYEECKDADILNGIAGYLGAEGRLERVEERTLRQNPVSLAERIDNFDEFRRYLERSGYVEVVERVPEPDAFLLNGAPYWMAPGGARVLFDVSGTATPPLVRAVLGGGAQRVQGRPGLQRWVEATQRPEAAAYIAHPVSRAYAVFMDLMVGRRRAEAFAIHAWIEAETGLSIRHQDEIDADPSYGTDAHRAGFLAFLRFLAETEAGRTGIPNRRIWLPQSQFQGAIARLLPGVRPLREGALSTDLAPFGAAAPHDGPGAAAAPLALAQVYSDEIEAQVREIYASDYANFGFGPWAEATAAPDASVPDAAGRLSSL